MNPDRYHVHFLGLLTSIAAHPDGPWPRWDAARAAAIEHLRDQVRECQKTLEVLGKAGSFWEYLWLCEEMVGSEVAQVQADGTIS